MDYRVTGAGQMAGDGQQTARAEPRQAGIAVTRGGRDTAPPANRRSFIATPRFDRSMFYRFAVGSLIFLPGLLVFFALFPGLDRTWQHPLLHFYLVTFFSFAAAVVTLFTRITLDRDSRPRHRLLATAFAAMGLLFFVHAITTPGAIIAGFNPGVGWAAWLTLLVGGLLFALASLDRPEHTLTARRMGQIHWILGWSYAIFAAVVFLVPSWLTAIETWGQPWLGQVVFVVTLGAWLLATVRLVPIWRLTRRPIDGVMALLAAWLTVASISLHRFPDWHLSWWLYHLLLLAGAITAIGGLAQAYEQLRRFRLSRYYGAMGLVITAALALLSAHTYSEVVAGDLVDEAARQAAQASASWSRQVAASLPVDGTLAGLEARAATSALAAGDGLRLAAVYDFRGEILWGESPLPAGETSDLLAVALTTGAVMTRFVEPAGHAHGAAGPAVQAPVLLAAAPVLTDAAEPAGALLTQYPLDALVGSTLRARRIGLVLAGLTMGTLFLLLLVVVRRADRLIARRNQQLELAYAEIQTAEARRDELGDMIVHDLRSPLTAINLSLNMLQKTLDRPERRTHHRELVRRALTSTHQMLGMVDQLLDVARLEAGQLRLEREALPLTRLLEDKAALYRPQAESEEKTIAVQSAPSLPPALADLGLLSRVLDNLIGNALKYTRPGGQIRLSARPEGDMLAITVADDGDGIPAQQLPQVFDKFFQATDEHGRPTRRGAGLGLAFCRLVIQAHGGHITAESAVGRGSSFTFSLPCADVAGEARLPLPTVGAPQGNGVPH